MSSQNDGGEYCVDTMKTQIGRLMVNFGNSQVINQFQREMSRYSVPHNVVDENDNVVTENNNSYLLPNSRKRLRDELKDDASYQKKPLKGSTRK